jgi:Cu(I)/Ag(I) efflux system membrane fusion protein
VQGPFLEKTAVADVEAESDEAVSAVPGTVRVDSLKRQLMGVRLETVEKSTQSHTVRLLGRVTTDETRVYRINAAVDGWIRKTGANTTGSLVRKDEILASFYSPEFLSAQQAYIYSLSSMDRFKVSGRDGPPQLKLTELNIRQYQDTLQNLGMSEIQIAEIAQTRQYTEQIQIRSPATGFVTVRNVSPGLRIDKGSELYRIVDLGRVWVVADVFENDLLSLKPGQTVRVVLRNRNKIFQARVSAVLPQFDAVSRTMKVRLEADNPDYLLRPDMFVDLEFPVTSPRKIVTVPAEAVLDSGLKRRVFVERAAGVFEPRAVETGARFGSRIEIVRGLSGGERIVVSGTFLIDSESRMDPELSEVR